MPRLIDVDKLKQHYSWWDGDMLEYKRIFNDIIDVQPTVEQTKSGNWIIKTSEQSMTCSTCGTVHLYYKGADEDQQYCSQCGSRMEGMPEFMEDMDEDESGR